jgi:CheY-like chemotaxis protein
MVELHGGTIHAHSAGLDQGSEFTIELPNAMLLPAADPAPTQTSATAAPSQAARLLIADDNRDAADSLGVLLEMEGYQVVVTHSGKEALEQAQKHQPSIFILDIGMPDMTGYEVARSIRQSDWGRSALLIALTGWGQNHDREKALQAGFDRHLTKPIDPAELAAVVAELVLDGNRH